jgi:hypothetical protein
MRVFAATPDQVHVSLCDTHEGHHLADDIKLQDLHHMRLHRSMSSYFAVFGARAVALVLEAHESRGAQLDQGSAPVRPLRGEGDLFGQRAH